jgi:hypothetical protein|nr:MAG TPA: hypothetical protein [Caudoviricetes sp.]
MDFKNERLMMSKEEARNRAKELFNENQVDLITKYMFLEQQCKKQQEVIDKANKKLNNFIDCCKAEKLESGSDYIHHQYWDMFERFNKQIKDILKEVLECNK